MSFKDQTLDKWAGWLERILGEVYDLYLNRHIFRRIRQLGTGHPLFQTHLSLPTNVYWHFLHATYIHYAAAAVRRQSQVNRQSISLRRLLLQLAEHPNLVTRAEFVAAETVPFANVQDETAAEAHTFFDRFAPAGAPHVDPLFVMDDAAGSSAHHDFHEPRRSPS